MVAFSTLLAALAVASAAHGAPLVKRIAQVIADSTQQWETACTAAGGALQCNPLSVAAFTTLLAAAGACDQQNAADNMVDLAKTLNNDASMIKFAQIFAQQPRNSPTSLSVQYCQSAPRNAELDGLFQCQFQSTNPTTFVGNVPVGQAGTIPFGTSKPLSPAGSCPAHTAGPITDGAQLVTITQDPGVGSSGSASASAPAAAPPAASSAAPSPSDNDNDPDSDSDCDSGDATPAAAAPPAASAPAAAPPAAAPPAAAPPAPAASSTSSFALQNGKDAQSLNAQFAALTKDSACTEPQNACIGTAFAQCVSGKFVLSDCGAANGLTCAALPLVNSAGTSITCTTPSDALARIAATGATGGLTGSS